MGSRVDSEVEWRVSGDDPLRRYPYPREEGYFDHLPPRSSPSSLVNFGSFSEHKVPSVS